MKTEENGIWSDFAQEGLDKMQKKERRKKVFNRVVNPLLLKYLTDPHGSEVSIAKKIPMKYLKYFKEVTGSGNGMKVRYRYRVIQNLGMVDLNHFVICTGQIHSQYMVDK